MLELRKLCQHLDPQTSQLSPKYLMGYALCRRPLTIVHWTEKCVCWRRSLLSAGTCRCSQLIRLIASSWSNEPFLAFGGCHLGCLVPPLWYPGRPFWNLGSTQGDHFGIFWRDHPGGPWEQLDGHEGVCNRIFVDFGLI